MTPRRRAVLAGASTLLLAGCMGGESGPDATTTGSTDATATDAGEADTTDTTDTTSGDGSDAATTDSGSGNDLPAELRREDGGLVVDYPEFSDGEVTIEQEFSIQFGRGDRFQVLGINDGELIEPGAADPPVEVSRTVAPTDRAWAFVAPVLREGSGFEFRVYVNAAFRDLGGMQLLAGVDGLQGTESNVLSRPAAFEEIADGVFRDSTSGEEVPGAQPGQRLTVLVSDVSFSELNEGSAAPTGVTCQPSGDGSVEGSTPNVAFNFNYDPETGALTISHECGDTVDGANLSVRLGGEPTDTQFEGSVSEGDLITVDASGYDSGKTLRIVWQNPEEDTSAVLAEYDLP